MRGAYSRGKNAMQYARECVGSAGSVNLPLATLIAYDLQAGSYVTGAREAVRECLRVARHAVVLGEPVYELASEAVEVRMRNDGYVRGLRAAAERLGAVIADF